MGSIVIVRAVRPNSSPCGSPCSNIWKRYWPSARKLSVTTVPPRVPNGAPGTRSYCDWVRGTSYVVDAVSASGSPSTARLT